MNTRLKRRGSRAAGPSWRASQAILLSSPASQPNTLTSNHHPPPPSPPQCQCPLRTTVSSTSTRSTRTPPSPRSCSPRNSPPCQSPRSRVSLGRVGSSCSAATKRARSSPLSKACRTAATSRGKYVPLAPPPPLTPLVLLQLTTLQELHLQTVLEILSSIKAVEMSPILSRLYSGASGTELLDVLMKFALPTPHPPQPPRA